MFLFRLAFWLTIVVWNLPRLDPPPPSSNAAGSTAPEPSKVAASLSCAQHKPVCDPPALAITFRGKTPNNGVPGSREESSQNTLRSSDLSPPWRGSNKDRQR